MVHIAAKHFLFLFLLGFAFSASCPSYPYHDWVGQYHSPQKPDDVILQYCNLNLGEICILTNLLNTTEDKKQFIAEYISNDSFAQILSWNSKTGFGKYPPGASKSSTNIKDAWISLAYINPSVYDNGIYLISNSSQVFTRQNFTFVVDTSRLSGDCKDNFMICGYDYSITTSNSGSAISAKLDVKSEYMVERYHLVRHCAKKSCWYTCDYYRTDSFKDHLSVSDSKSIRYENFSGLSNYSISKRYNNLSEILVNASDPNVVFNIGNSNFQKTEYLYKTRYELEPYDFLVKELVHVNETSEYGLSVLEKNGSGFLLLAPYSENCTLFSSGHFASKNLSGCKTNLSDTTTKPNITPTKPKFLDSILDIALAGVVISVLYQILKKVGHHA